MPPAHTGACLCGAVIYTVTGTLRAVVACHCRQCRKQSGHFYAATSARDDALKIEGANHLAWYRSSPMARRGFCGTCGSLLFWKQEGSNATSILAGSLDQPTGLSIAKHIHCASKGDYYEINDPVPLLDED